MPIAPQTWWVKPRVTVEVPFGVGMACGLTPQCLPVPSCTSPPPAFAADRKVPLPPFPPSCNKVDIAGKPLHLRHYSPKRGLTTLGVRPLPQAINPHSSRTSWPHLGEMLALRGVMFTPSLFSLRRRPAPAGLRPRSSAGAPPPVAPRSPNPDWLRHRSMGLRTPVGSARPKL